MASTKSTSPPNGVHATAVATPGIAVRCATSSEKKNSGLPRNSVTLLRFIVTCLNVPLVIWVATFLQTFPILRSKFRTPAYRV